MPDCTGRSARFPNASSQISNQMFIQHWIVVNVLSRLKQVASCIPGDVAQRFQVERGQSFVKEYLRAGDKKLGENIGLRQSFDMCARLFGNAGNENDVDALEAAHALSGEQPFGIDLAFPGRAVRRESRGFYALIKALNQIVTHMKMFVITQHARGGAPRIHKNGIVTEITEAIEQKACGKSRFAVAGVAGDQVAFAGGAALQCRGMNIKKSQAAHSFNEREIEREVSEVAAFGQEALPDVAINSPRHPHDHEIGFVKNKAISLVIPAKRAKYDGRIFSLQSLEWRPFIGFMQVKGQLR